MGPQIQNFILICCFFTWRRPSKCLRIISIVFLKKSFATRERSKICRFLDLHSQKYCQSTAMCPFLKISTATKSFHPTAQGGIEYFFSNPVTNCGSNPMNIRPFQYVNLWGQGLLSFSFSWLRCFHRLQNVCLFLENVVFEVRSYMPRSFLSFDDIQ